MTKATGSDRSSLLAKLLSALIGSSGGRDHVPSGPVVELLEQVRAIGDPRVLPCLIWLLGSAEVNVRRAAAETIDCLMPRDPKSLDLLEATVRGRGLYGIEAWWPSDGPRQQSRISEIDARAAIAAGLPLHVLGLLSMNANGRVRELATLALSGQLGGEEVPYLLLRANDWVPQVSQIATRGLHRRLKADYSGVLAQALPLVEHVAIKRRVNNSHLVHSVRALLMETDAGLAAIAATFDAGERDARRAAARLVHSWGQGMVFRFSQGLADSDLIVRTQLAAAVLDGANRDQLIEWLPRFLADRSARIRASAFSTASAKCPELLVPVLRALLFDGNVWLREFARQKMLEGGKQDFAALYSEAISAQRPELRAALAGLGEVGGETHAKLALPFVSRGGSRVRQTALRTVSALLKQKAAPIVLESLGSESAGLSKVALELAMSGRPLILADEVTPLCSSVHGHVRANALRALAKMDRWEALIAGIQHAADSEPRAAVAAQRILARWKHVPANLYARPGNALRERLLLAIAGAPPSLNQVSETVNAVLGST